MKLQDLCDDMLSDIAENLLLWECMLLCKMFAKFRRMFTDKNGIHWERIKNEAELHEIIPHAWYHPGFTREGQRYYYIGHDHGKLRRHYLQCTVWEPLTDEEKRCLAHQRVALKIGIVNRIIHFPRHYALTMPSPDASTNDTLNGIDE